MNKNTYKAFRWVDSDFQTGIDTFAHELVENQEWDIPITEMTVSNIADVFGDLSDISSNAAATHELIEEFRRDYIADVDNFDETFKAWSDYACAKREDFSDEEWHALLVFSFIFREVEEIFHISSYKLIQNIKFWYMYGRGNVCSAAKKMVYRTAKCGYMTPADRLEFLTRFRAVNRKMQKELLFDCVRLDIAGNIFPTYVDVDTNDIEFTDTNEIVVRPTMFYRPDLTDDELDELDV